MDVTGIDKAKLLAALYEETRPVGLGVLHDKGGMTPEEAAEIIAHMAPRSAPMALHFDYVAGRPIKVSIVDNPDGTTTLHRAYLFDRDAGRGACERAVEWARKQTG